jgi:hypothetical protein
LQAGPESIVHLSERDALLGFQANRSSRVIWDRISDAYSFRFKTCFTVELLALPECKGGKQYLSGEPVVQAAPVVDDVINNPGSGRAADDQQHISAGRYFSCLLDTDDNSSVNFGGFMVIYTSFRQL